MHEPADEAGGPEIDMTGGAEVVRIDEAGARLDRGVQRVDTGFASRLGLFLAP